MKKYFCKILTFSLIPAIFSAAVLCCPYLKTAEAGHFSCLLNVEKPMPACHAHHGKADATAKTENCCKLQLPADHPPKISLNIPQTVNGLVLLNILFPQKFVLKDQFNFACLDGPPGWESDPPLYILSHNFRI